MTPRNAAPLLLVLSLVLALGTCNQAIMVAPAGSTMTLFANPTFIAAHGDVSVISGLVIEPSGQPVADGTVVQFFTNLGRIQEQGKTNDGVVRVNLTSDSRSGPATVTAVSGGDVTAPPPTTTAAAPPVAAAAGLASAMSVTGASAVSAAQASATVTVTIGSALPDHVLVSADPPRITANRTSTITAQVFDANGNPVANVPVFFTIDGNPSTERLASGGRQMFTDNDGRVTDTLRTNALPDALPRTITVKATTANNKSGTALVTIN